MSRIKRVPLTRAMDELTALVEKRGAQPLVLTQKGKMVAVVFPCETEDDLVHLSWARSPRLHEIVAQREFELHAGKGIPHDEFWRQLDEEYADQDSQTESKAVAKKRAKRSHKSRAKA